MAVLYVSEFRNLPFTDNDVGQFANAAEWAADQTVAIGGTSTPSSAFNAATRFVLLSADSVCSVAWTLPGASTAQRPQQICASQQIRRSFLACSRA